MFYINPNFINPNRINLRFSMVDADKPYTDPGLYLLMGNRLCRSADTQKDVVVVFMKAKFGVHIHHFH